MGGSRTVVHEIRQSEDEDHANACDEDHGVLEDGHW